MNIPPLQILLDQKEKKAFYPSDFGKLECDLWCGLKNIPHSNPVKWYETLRWGAGKGVEMQMLKVLKDSGITPLDYEQEKHGRIEIVREGVEIHGYIDALNFAGEPIEIKSINNKNSYDIKKYEAGYPKENYVGQLAVYMDALGVQVGYLFAASTDGLSTFWFECRRVENGTYRCGNVTINITEEYKRWASLKEKIQRGEEPQWNECRYKIPLSEIDWTKVSSRDITEARMGRKVIGDGWQVSYSPWKNLIIEKQGSSLGYSDEELRIINEATKGYSAKRKVVADEQ